jgi:hypothetical protein
MISEFARVLREQVRQDMNNYCDDLASGVCQSFDQYQKLCGVIQGLAIAEQYIIDLAKKVEKANDES